MLFQIITTKELNMQALTLTQFKKPGLNGISLQERPVNEPLGGQVLVRMRAAALNHADLHIAGGEMKMMSPIKPPFVLGVEGAGVVAQVGAQVTKFEAGDEVFFYTGLVHCGTLGEYMTVDAYALAFKPANWTFEKAAASALGLLCADLSLTRAGVDSDQRLLVHGGGGAVGSAAIMLARARGAQVDTTASHSDAAYLHNTGASHVFDYKSQPINRLPNAAYDVVLEGMGGKMFMQSLALIKSGGVIVSLKVMTSLNDMLRMGMQPPAIVKWMLPLVFGRYIRAARKAGVRLEGVATFADGARLEVLGELASQMGYQPRIAQTFNLNEAMAALRLFTNGAAKGKVVVNINE